AQNFDVIRLSTYRTACKLRFVQKRCNLHLVDVWNMIEAFRDNGLSTLDHNAEINVSRLETILSSIFYQLNKRLPTTHQINVDQSIGLLLNFMVATYDSEGHGKLTVFCYERPMLAYDEWRYIFQMRRLKWGSSIQWNCSYCGLSESIDGFRYAASSCQMATSFVQSCFWRVMPAVPIANQHQDEEALLVVW
ncbi:hypothetical protein cypCar_00029480, partial [Cyprinus carpio]